MSGSGGSAGAPKSPHGPFADGDCLEDIDNWDLGDLLTSGARDPRSLLEADFDWVGVACERVAMESPATLADVVTVVEAGLESHQELSSQVALVQW